MSVTPTSLVPSTPAATTAAVNTQTQAQTGLASVGSSISSAAASDAGTSRGFCGSIKDFFANIFSRIWNYLFPETDKTRVAFVQENLDKLGEVEIVEEASDKFSRITNAKMAVASFKEVQNSPDVSAETTRAFFYLLPSDTRDHIQRQIWIENGRVDNGQGLLFGQNVINGNIKSDLVARAIDKCLSER